jgi:hypothetical protein
MKSFHIRFGFALAVFCSLSALGSAFSFSEIVSKQAGRAKGQSGNIIDTAATSLGVTAPTRPTSVVEEDAVNIYKKANEFAFRDELSSYSENLGEYDTHYHPLSDEEAEIEESKYWLREIINLQSGCAAGTLMDKDICEDQAKAAEIVARLRRKIEIHENRVALRTKESESIVPTIATELIIGALLAVVAIFWSTLDLGERHNDIPTLSNFQQWQSVLEEKEYLLSLFKGGP